MLLDDAAEEHLAASAIESDLAAARGAGGFDTEERAQVEVEVEVEEEEEGGAADTVGRWLKGIQGMAIGTGWDDWVDRSSSDMTTAVFPADSTDTFLPASMM